ncbi:hypothetical protein PROFUN_16453 [Planoprotostelium fungivorum]|uniref:Uncharacterized protein n=1 Tax=Planoprotostelium fungivorum TaxID=1890364 RepID=A0A2P6MQK5_9EUKA|nr:hypothetical protein PROFUN_16453 [Planoprotostelium fungivorum]
MREFKNANHMKDLFVVCTSKVELSDQKCIESVVSLLDKTDCEEGKTPAPHIKTNVLQRVTKQNTGGKHSVQGEL